MAPLAEQIPEKLRGRFAEITAITDRFCDEHLDAEFKRLCRDMVATLIVEGCPLASGKAAGWAAAVVYSIGWVNFLNDPSQPHHMTAVDMAKAVGVSEATLMNRAKVIRQGLDLRRMDPRWSTEGDDGPLTRWSGWSRSTACLTTSARRRGTFRRKLSAAGSSRSCQATSRTRRRAAERADGAGAPGGAAGQRQPLRARRIADECGG